MTTSGNHQPISARPSRDELHYRRLVKSSRIPGVEVAACQPVAVPMKWQANRREEDASPGSEQISHSSASESQGGVVSDSTEIEGDFDSLAGTPYQSALGTRARSPTKDKEPKAIKLHGKSAQEGSAIAQLKLGLCLERGTGVEQDTAAALEWYRRAAEQGYSYAQFKLGFCLENGIGGVQPAGRMASTNPDRISLLCSATKRAADNHGAAQQAELETIRWYRKAAEQGLPCAQFRLGLCLESGKAGERDTEQAEMWYKKAAEQGLACAQHKLGLCYKKIYRSPLREAYAMFWYRKSTTDRAANAQYDGELLPNSFGGARQFEMRAVLRYLTSAGQKIPHALEKVAFGTKGSDKLSGDRSKDIRKYRRLADQGDARAQLNLGVCLETGDGVEKDLLEAEVWYREAASQGFANAQCRLAFFLENSNGHGKDMTQAVQWYREAASQGYSRAQWNLALYLEYGFGVERDKEAAVLLYRKASVQGDMVAQWNLGICLEGGVGVEVNQLEAVLWYRKAAEQGFGKAQCSLGCCLEKGIGVEQDMLEAMYWYRQAAQRGVVKR